MNRVFFISKRRLQWYLILAVAVVLVGAYVGWQQSKPALAPIGGGPQVQQVKTVEFNMTDSSGKQQEGYRFDPGTIVVQKGVEVELRLSGVNGESHPFEIQGLGVSGEIAKGKTTIVKFTPKQAGTYPIICTTHTDPPMVGYLVVQ
ncbi:cupredoxin domain-containing protein [Cohnella zeiphila]|uniref:Cupredoxin domain-containing protein n=1 Tax=Cohnella zeiphila TaxID=2761120 RepID=A0A7X0SL52_9BACL|nr:cupredoxin domain-containing protein [Cohnella zeiphila]MBB6731941.1 cupredoxin domain-containing protein [Cohnella zeiphila]